MASRLRVDEILPSVGNNIAIGTAIGSVSFANATYTVGTGASVFSPTTNTLAFGTNNTEKLRITSSGNIGIGTIPQSWSGFRSLQLGGTTSIWSVEGGQAGSSFYSNNIYYDGSNRRYLTNNSASEYIQDASTGNHIFYEASSGTAGNTLSGYTEIARFTSNGLKFSSGLGIDFSATGEGSGTMSSELLDDYEEGTFTPGIQGTTVGGSASFAVANGTYTKVGRLVTIQVYMSWSSGTGSGAMQITGLPFSTLSGNRFYAASISDSTISTSANHILRGRTENSATTIILKEEPVGGGSQKNGTYDSAAQIVLSCSYHTSS